jgi:hypothetical protein
VLRAWRLSNAFVAAPSSYEAIAELIRSRVPAGSLLVTENVLMTSVLYAYLPEYQYLCAYDPILLYASSPEAFWRWENLVSQGRNCPRDDCGPGSADAREAADAIHALGSDWFVSFFPRSDYSVVPLMRDHPERFHFEGAAPARVGYLSLWHVR